MGSEVTQRSTPDIFTHMLGRPSVGIKKQTTQTLFKSPVFQLFSPLAVFSKLFHLLCSELTDNKTTFLTEFEPKKLSGTEPLVTHVIRWGRSKLLTSFSRLWGRGGASPVRISRWSWKVELSSTSFFSCATAAWTSDSMTAASCVCRPAEELILSANS